MSAFNFKLIDFNSEKPNMGDGRWYKSRDNAMLQALKMRAPLTWKTIIEIREHIYEEEIV